MFTNLITFIHRTTDHQSSEMNRAFTMLIKAYSAGLYKYAAWLCNDQRHAEKLVESTFSRLRTQIKSLSNMQSLKYELFKILKNEYESQKQHMSISEMQKKLNREDDLSPNYSKKTNSIVLRSALRALPKDQREPLEMQIINGFSCSEISAFLNISKDQTLERLVSARETLLELMSDDQPVVNHHSAVNRHSVSAANLNYSFSKLTPQ